MKRIREDAYGGSQLKRPFDSSRGDSYEQSQPPVGRGGGSSGVGTGGSSSHKLTTTDALSYLKEVKEMFQDQKDRYDLFLEIMKDFKAQRTDTTGVIARVKELFKGHNNLIFGFNTFLPKGYEITLDDEEAPPKKTVEFQEAISFVNKIKRRFQNDEHIYKTFLDILNMYRKEHKDINEVYSEVAVLFVEHPDLLAEFIRFLPDSSATPSTDHIAYGRNSATHFNEQNYPAPMLRNGQVDKRYRQSPHNDLHLSYDRTEMDDDRVMMEVHKDQKRRAEKENRDRRNRDQDVRELEQDNIRDFNSQRMSDKRKSTRRVEGFGMNAYFSSYDDKDGLKGMYDQGFIFCEKVKETLCSSDDYQAFLKCLHIYSNGIIKRNDLQNLVTDLLGKYPDLMDEFNDFLERCENIDGFLAGIMSKKSRVSDGHLSRSMKVEDRDKEQKRELEYCKERERIREKYMAKSIQELDLSNCQCCTPSYRLLPEDYPIPSASHRTELGVEVLNNHWVSVTSGSEDYSFKHMCRNQYEESLFKCEDDRFELDMLLESVSSTAKRAEDVLNNINENKLNVDAPICIEDHLTALNLRCIERLYGDHGLDVMDILRRNPSLALPVILTRLKQKQEEWTRCRSDFNKVWAEIYAKNHYKSLDHRSFYFKQQDSKNLSAKSLHAEIKELKELKQKEDDIILAIGAKNQHPIMPQLEFEYPDISIHEDLYKLIKYSCEELCSTKEQLSKVMKLWTTFLEPILGVTSHPRSCEDNKVVSKGRNHASNFMASNIRENSESPDGDATIDDSKHPNSDRNDDIHALPEPAGLCMGGLVKDNLAKGNDILSVPRSSGDNLVCNSALWPQKELNNVDSTVKASGLNKQVASGEEVATYNASLAGEASNSHCRYIHEETSGRATVPLRPNTGTCEGNPVAKVDISVVHSLEAQSGGDTKLPLLENIMNIEVGKVNKGLEESIGPSIIEKEEGELSPNGDAEEDDFPVIPLSKGNTGGENCANANIDDEDSENVFRAGKGVSGSDSAGDECSREKLEEEEDGEHGQIVGKAESEGEAEGITDAHFVGDGTSFPLPECFLQSVKPLARHVPMIPPAEQRKESYVFYGNDDFYMLFRLHQVLYDRILSAKKNSVGAEMKWRTPQDSDTSNPYARFMTALYNLLDGSVDNTKFEDECRSIIGNQSYSLFTLDKLIYKLVKQLQTVATDEMDLKLIQLYEYEKIRKSGIIDCVYHDNVWVLSHEEKMYRFGYISTPSMLSIQLMDSICEKPEMLAVSVEPNFSTYLHNEFLTISPEKEHRFLLKRNFKKYAGLDGVAAICLAMKCVKSVYNGLECKMACDSSKDQIQARKSEKQKRTRNRFGGHILKTTYVMSTADSFARASRPIEYKIRRKLPAHLNL